MYPRYMLNSSIVHKYIQVVDQWNSMKPSTGLCITVCVWFMT